MSNTKAQKSHFVIENPEGLYDPSANAYSHIAVVPSDKRLVFIAGQGGGSGAFGTQVRQAFVNIRTAIGAAGGTLGDVAKLTVLSVDHGEDKHRALIAEVERAFGNTLKPTCTIIPVPRLGREDQLVEIEAVGVLESQAVRKDNNARITGADHVNWRVMDAERSLRFYRDVLGLEAYHEPERSFVTVRVSPEFTLHLRPDAASTFHEAESGNHLALVVEGTVPDAMSARLAVAGYEIERSSEQVLGARGMGTALYVRDPDGYLLELKFYA